MPAPTFVDPLLQKFANFLWNVNPQTFNAQASLTGPANSTVIEGWPTIQMAPGTLAVYYLGQEPDSWEEWATLVDIAIQEVVEITWFWNPGTTVGVRAQMQADARAALRVTSQAIHAHAQLTEGAGVGVKITDTHVGPLRDATGSLFFVARIRCCVIELAAEPLTD